MRNDLAARGNTCGKGRNGGRSVGNHQQRLNMISNNVHMEEVIRLGMVAVVNKGK